MATNVIIVQLRLDPLVFQAVEEEVSRRQQRGEKNVSRNLVLNEWLQFAKSHKTPTD